MKKFSQSCENNKAFIAAQIADVLSSDSTTTSDMSDTQCVTPTQPHYILEVGSGTGQHAAYIPQVITNIVWQASDLAENLPSIAAWREDLSETDRQRCLAPIELDVAAEQWPNTPVANIFTANTLHIIAWPLVEQLIRQAATHLQLGGHLMVYGPFNYAQEYTSTSNAQFDEWLKTRDARSGIRDIEAVQAIAEEVDLVLIRDTAMPANNRFLTWQKKA